ncbi:MAG TPA: NAD(P)-binding domain-containing protein [Pseudolabrys sp.]|uniref:lactate/malate family dehydrogenase n=1 Tax=Pseudolabrys sp. TaxID=1960880 RepID=UPI002DDD7AA8|nr:NAD(P)-binding domain-containing protein [Pseudolabrys sp.]HEV2629021.1 NAD(P)-binding domain-containing protein [Pseudolabrys sp.]
MKLGIIGAGKVGCACALTAVNRGTAREIVLVNRTRKTAAAVATDIRYGLPLSPRADIRDGDDADLAGCGVVMITSGINEKTGGATDRNDSEGRLRLLDKNAAIYRHIVPRIVKAAPEAVLLVVTDPPDPLADVARMAAGHTRVISAGTYLDSQRFRVHLARHFDVDPATVEAQVLGEHGTSQIFAWSTARIGGVPVADLLKRRGEDAKAMHETLEKDVRYANITIIEGNDASQYGIAIVACRIAEMILRDERAAIPIGSYHEHYGVTLSLPSVVGRGGIVAVLAPALSAEEDAALTRSAESIAKAMQRVKG